MSEGFFLVDRELLTHPIWTDEPFNKGAAWVDLIGRANWKKRESFYGGRCVIIKRGQLITSIGALAARWKWSEKRVRSFLSALSEAGMVRTEGTPRGTLITVENYAKYQDQGRAKGQTEGQASTPQRASGGRAWGVHKNKDNKDKQGEQHARAGARPPGVPDDWEEAR